MELTDRQEYIVTIFEQVTKLVKEKDYEYALSRIKKAISLIEKEFETGDNKSDCY